MQIVNSQVRKMVDVHNDVVNSERAETAQRNLEHRPASNFDQSFWPVIGKWTQPSP
jgi:hypothetical protein